MYLDSFHQIKDGLIDIQPEQASRFAKEVAGDFNPLHNVGAKRFCVPGDLLFAMILAKRGLYQQMFFDYVGMVGEGILLDFPQNADASFSVVDKNEKEYLKVENKGEVLNDFEVIEKFTRAYVAFSGHSFPDILVPLMKKHQVMVNPIRPMVIYDNMSFKLDKLNLVSPSLELSDSTLEVNGKRGEVRLLFQVLDGGVAVGKGCKTMLLSGLKAYDAEAVSELVLSYTSVRDNYKK